eukprot:SAG11_NODE_493_length_8965_cov_4.112339_4_plen_804_part_00
MLRLGALLLAISAMLRSLRCGLALPPAAGHTGTTVQSTHLTFILKQPLLAALKSDEVSFAAIGDALAVNLTGVYREGAALIRIVDSRPGTSSNRSFVATCHDGAAFCGWSNATGTVCGRAVKVVFLPSGATDAGAVIGSQATADLQLRWIRGGTWSTANPGPGPVPPAPPPPPPPPWDPSPFTFEVTQLHGQTSTGAVVCGLWSNDSVHAAAQCSPATYNSDFHFNYNPSHVPLPDGKSDALLVRTQKLGGAPFKLALVKRLGPPGLAPASMRFEKSTDENIVFEPQPGPDSPDRFGTEDPYLAYRPKDQTYYLFYTAVAETASGQVFNATLSLSTCKGNPADKACWQRRGALLPDHPWMGKTCCGGLLLRDDAATATDPQPYHYIFFGEGAVLMARTRTPEIAASYELITEQADGNRSLAAAVSAAPPSAQLARAYAAGVTPKVLLRTRPGYFDGGSIEGGPQPMRLSSGDYIYFYDNAGWEEGYPTSTPNYHPAWAILDRDDPIKVLWRASAPLINVTQAWEKDGLTPWCIFLDGISRTAGTGENDDDFILWYGGADTVVGARRVVVKIVKVKADDESINFSAASIVWKSAQQLTVINNGPWPVSEPEAGGMLRRLPFAAKSVVRPTIYGASQDTAGLAVRFRSNARELLINASVTSASEEMPHMPATGASGFDLYCWDDASQSYRWLALWTPAAHQHPWPTAASGSLSGDAPLPALEGGAAREFVLYLPLYNGVEYVSIGVERGASLLPSPPKHPRPAPVVFYGTSITQVGTKLHAIQLSYALHVDGKRYLVPGPKKLPA